MPENTDLADLESRLLGWPGKARVLVAIAGAPGAGKSTVARALVARLNAARPGLAALLEMDGYHYDDRVLGALGRQARKGAPDTFDVGGLRHMLTRLRDPSEGAVAVPVFDREIEIARAGGALISPGVRFIIAEGNYLLLDSPPWADLAAMFDLRVMVTASPETLRRRLTARWQGFGYGPAEIRDKVENNDLPNGRMIAAGSVPAELLFPNDEDTAGPTSDRTDS